MDREEARQAKSKVREWIKSTQTALQEHPGRATSISMTPRVDANTPRVDANGNIKRRAKRLDHLRMEELVQTGAFTPRVLQEGRSSLMVSGVPEPEAGSITSRLSSPRTDGSVIPSSWEKVSSWDSGRPDSMFPTIVEDIFSPSGLVNLFGNLFGNGSDEESKVDTIEHSSSPMSTRLNNRAFRCDIEAPRQWKEQGETIQRATTPLMRQLSDPEVQEHEAPRGNPLPRRRASIGSVFQHDNSTAQKSQQAIEKARQSSYKTGIWNL